MPGMFGGTASSATRLETFGTRFRTIWPDAQIVTGPGWVIGAHAFRGEALRRAESGSITAWDGDSRAQIALAEARQGPNPAQTSPVADACNIASFDPADGSWALHVDWSGAFPLYLAQSNGSVLFSSHLRPLAAVLGSEPDEVACLWFLREGAIHGRRSFFKGIRRLDGGDTVRWTTSELVPRITNTSALWTPTDGEATSGREAVRELTHGLARVMTETIRPSARPALMMSGGWDSRTLAGVATADPSGSRLCAYFHGDPESRERRIAERVASQCHFAFLIGNLDPSIFALEDLQAGFERTENVVFPHWHAAGRRLRSSGIDLVTAGIFGEVLGGHYGSAMVLPGRRKPWAVLSALLGRTASGEGQASDQLDRVVGLFSPRSLRRPWYLREDAWAGGDAVPGAMRDDVAGGLDTLVRRGVTGTDALIEAYITERRAAQYISAQLLSCRAVLDIGAPFIERSLLLQASRIPLSTKIHNRLNREILAGSRPDLLAIPLAATLVGAGAPILAREASRLVRKLMEDRAWRRHFSTAGATPPPRYAWANFEFVRSSGCLLPIAEDLRLGLWDRSAIIRRLTELSGDAWQRPAHPMVDMLMKIYTVDLMLR